MGDTQTLEQKLDAIKRKPRKRRDFPYPSRFVMEFPIDILLDEESKNYRTHTQQGNAELAKSIKERGLLEPLSVAYDAEKDSFELIDGEGRLLACHQLHAVTVPVEIFYDVSREDKFRMKLAANAAKTRIDSTDLALFAKNLVDLLQDYVPEEAARISEHAEGLEGMSTRRMSKAEIAQTMGMHPSTLQNYLVFADLPDPIKDYVKDHRQSFPFGRAVKIGRALERQQDRLAFFRLMRKKTETRRKELLAEAQKTTGLLRISDRKAKLDETSFNDLLQKAMAQSTKRAFSLEHMANGRDGRQLLHTLFDYLRTAQYYVHAFKAYTEHYPPLLDRMSGYACRVVPGHLPELLDTLLEKADSMATHAPPDVMAKRDRMLSGEKELSFKDRILSRVAGKNGKISPTAIRTLADRIDYIPYDQLRLTSNQPRKTFRTDRINALAEEMKRTGQIKPGMVRHTGTRQKDGKPLYTMVFGQTRVKAGRKAGLETFKAFVVDDLSPVEIAILQCMEDLSETDTPAERAEGLYTYYKFLKDQIGEDYDPATFIREQGHLGSETMLRKVFSYQEASPLIKDLVKARLIGYDAGIQLSKLRPQDQTDILLQLMSSDAGNLSERIQKKLEHQDQALLAFDQATPCFSPLFRLFEQKVYAPFQNLDIVLSNNSEMAKRVMNNPLVHYRIAKIKEGVQAVKDAYTESR